MATEDRYINLTSDFGFKRIFGTDMNKDLLIGFLNALFAGRFEISDLTYKNSEHLGTNDDARRAIFDVYCQTADGSRFVVEMQNAYQAYFKDRTVYYSTFPISEQAKKGLWDYRLDPVYTVSILNFPFAEEIGCDVVTEVRLMNVKTKAVFYDKFGMVYIALSNFHKDEHHLGTLLDKWLFVLKNMRRLMERPAALQERVFQRLFKAAEIATYTPEERREYEQSQRAYNDIKNAIDTAESQGMEKGLEKGRAEGRAEGREEGRVEGRAEGRAEGMKAGREEIARNLLKMGMSVKQVSAATGLSADDITGLVS